MPYRFLTPLAPLVVILVSVTAGTARSQVPADVAAGDRVRVRAPSLVGGRVSGMVREVTATELLLSADETHMEIRIPLAGLAELRRYTGPKRHVLNGIIAGSMSGALVATAVGGSDFPGAEDRRARLGAILGGVLGGALGYLRPTAEWTSLSLLTVRPVLLPGMVVRVADERLQGPERVEGTLGDVTPDSVVFVPRGGTALRLARTSIRSLDWPLRQKRATAKGALIGASIGLVGGAVAALATYQACSGFLCFSPGGAALFAGVVIGGLGSMAGGTIGYLSHVTVWESEHGRRSAVALAPSIRARGVGFVASVSF
jgi:hypothetical protein